MALTEISENYIITNYSASVGEREERDPANDSAGGAATGSIEILSSGTGNLDGGTVTITDHNGLEKVYIFDDDGGGDTGTVDGSDRIRVQISGVDKDAFATQLKTAIVGSTGHNGSITIAGPGLDYTGDGKLHLTQSSGGISGNNTITSDLNDGFLNPVGFAGGQTGTEAYKSAVVAPFILATKSMQNLRGQTTGSHYITFLGDPKC